MRIWFQLMASEERSKPFLDAVQAQCDAVAFPGTTVEVKGTTHGAYADQFGLLFHHDEREIVQNGIIAQADSSYDAYVIANSLDPGLVALRETLTMPVLSMMEVSCFFACMTGERFGIVASNDKFMPRYRSIVDSYGLSSRLAGIDSLKFDALPNLHTAFTDADTADQVVTAFTDAAHRLIARGADVLIAPGIHTSIMAARGIRQIGGAVVQDSYPLLLKVAESTIGIHRSTGVWTSRGDLYRSPAPELVRWLGGNVDDPLLSNWT